MPSQRQMEVEIAKRKYMKNKKDHDLPVGVAAEKYGVVSTTVTKWRKELGFKTQYEISMDRQARIRAHPQFGNKGDPAPCHARVIARDLNENIQYIWKVRRDAGVGTHDPIATFSQDDLMIPYKKRRHLTVVEKRNYKLCRTMNTWGRPRGINRHLEELREAKN